ncbi:MAG: hypothetical protein J0H14_05655 [Alphaproteobacteria bacterium]|nr:hypothetical protein [Alphaproteobacteria bacterium]
MRCHPLDPPAQHRAAIVFGRLVAAGLLTREECLPHLVRAGLRARRVDPAGLRARLAHTLHDAAVVHARRRRRAARVVREAIAPLLAVWAAPAAIHAAARAANAGLGAPLLAREVEAIAADEAARVLARG